jgi:hypothetical protein
MQLSTKFQLYCGGKNLHIKTNIVKKQKYLSNENLTKLPTLLGVTGPISDLGPKININT